MKKLYLDCMALALECADDCHLAALPVVRGSEHINAVCSACAAVCQTCASECAKQPMDHYQRCAEACKQCAAIFVAAYRRHCSIEPSPHHGGCTTDVAVQVKNGAKAVI